MIFIQTYLPKKLSPFIRSFWYLKVPEDLTQPYIEEILPDGHHEIIFHLNSTSDRKRSGSEDWWSEPTAFFTGQNRKSYAQKLNPGAVIYGVRFHPHTQALFYDFPASLSTDNLIPISDIFTNDALGGCICESPEKTFANLDMEFTKKASQIKNYGATFLYVDAAVRQIICQAGNVKIEFLEKMTGVSSRHLEKSFQKFVGISPKQFCSMAKYNHFITYRKDNPNKTLTECAYEAEFHDQSHLIRLSHRLAGQTPKSYFNKPNHINDFFLTS